MVRIASFRSSVVARRIAVAAFIAGGVVLIASSTGSADGPRPFGVAEIPLETTDHPTAAPAGASAIVENPKQETAASIAPAPAAASAQPQTGHAPAPIPSSHANSAPGLIPAPATVRAPIIARRPYGLKFRITPDLGVWSESPSPSSLVPTILLSLAGAIFVFGMIWCVKLASLVSSSGVRSWGLTVSTKLAFACTLSASLLLAIAGAGASAANRAADAGAAALNASARAEQMTRVHAELSTAVAWSRVIRGEPTDAAIDAYTAGVTTAATRMDRLMTLVAGTPATEPLSQLSRLTNELDAATHTLVALTDRNATDTADFGDLSTKSDVVAAAATALSAKLDADLHALAASHTGSAANFASASAYTLAGVGMFGMLIAVAAGWTLVRTIGVGLTRVLPALRAVAAGDLTHQPLNSDAKDELGELARATDDMAARLADLIGEVAVSTGEVSTAATQIATSAEQMSAAVGEVARQAAHASQSAQLSGDIARAGGDVVLQTVEGMHEIDQAVTASATSVGELGKRGQEIGRVIKVINDIADQTNLLALNAAIEAARAGEHGRGFAVVADEVRKLAERTTRATTEITTSIESIQNETRHAVDRMAKGTEHVKLGVSRAQAAGCNLRQIVDNTTEVASMIASITSASEEAGAGAGQSAAAASELSVKSEQLMVILSRFRVGSSGASRRVA